MRSRLTKLAKELRKRMTYAEIILWNKLRLKQLGAKFRRQQPLGPYIVDFVCFEKKLIIEVGGGQHYEREDDSERDKYFYDNGYKILRFWNNEVIENIEGVFEVILNTLSPSPNPSRPFDSAQGRQGRGTLNTIIIGAGPAGIAAAIQLKRAGVEFILIEKGEVGGLLLNANLVENYPGFSKGLSGPDLVERFKQQMDSLGITPIHDEVLSVDVDTAGSPSPNPSHPFDSAQGRQGRGNNSNFTIKTRQTTYGSKNLIIASGTRAKRLDRTTYDKGIEERIFYEAYPLRDIKGRHIAIVGSGDAAFDYALNLSGNNRVSILFRSTNAKCLPLLYKRAGKLNSISLHPATEIIKISTSSLPLDGGGKVRVITTPPSPNPSRQGRENAILTDFVLAAIGREPAMDFLSTRIKNHFLEKGGIPGLYYAGDVARGLARQVAIAVGDGVRAAMSIINSWHPSPQPSPQGGEGD